jgi:hypothetical protein
MRGDEFPSNESISFYVFSSILLQQIRSVDIIHRFPGVITLGVSLPFDQVLQDVTVPKVLMISDGFDLVLSFSSDKVRWQLGEVQAILCHFMIGQ